MSLHSHNPYMVMVAVARKQHPDKVLTLPVAPAKIRAPEVADELTLLTIAREFYQIEFRHYEQPYLLPAAPHSEGGL